MFLYKYSMETFGNRNPTSKQRTAPAVARTWLVASDEDGHSVHVLPSESVLGRAAQDRSGEDGASLAPSVNSEDAGEARCRCLKKNSELG